MPKDRHKTKPRPAKQRSELPRALRVRSWRERVPGYFRWYRSLGFAWGPAAWHALLRSQGRPQAYRRGPAR